MGLTVTGRLKLNSTFFSLIFALFMAMGCTPANTQFGFDFSSEKVSAELSLKFDVDALNVQNLAKVNISGSCRDKSTLKILSPIQADLSCDQGSFQKSLDLSSLSDGNINFKIEELNVFKELNYVEGVLIKDMTMPSLTFPQPADLASGTFNISLSGTCSENGESVKVFESSTNLNQEVLCQNLAWIMNFSLGADAGISSFLFKAIHQDKAKNSISVSTSSVNRVVVGDFSIVGMGMTSNGPFTSLLKGSFNNYSVSWTAAANITNFSILIKEFNILTSSYDIQKCSVSGIAGSATLYNFASGCNLNPGSSYQIRITGNNTLYQQVVRTLNFNTTALPVLKTEMRKLYISTSFDSATVTSLNFSDLIDNYNSINGQYSMTVNGFDAAISSLISVDSPNQKLNIAPGTTRVSGRFIGNLVITDPFGNTSSNQQIVFYLVTPYTWVGLADNDFNKPGNWCGTFTLTGGCQGAVAPPSFATKIMIDDMCLYPTLNAVTNNCSPRLTSNTNVNSFYLKANSFDQAGYSLNVGDTSGPTSGDIDRRNSFFKQTGGVFNSSSSASSGSLIVLNQFIHADGNFYAPYGSDFTISSQDTHFGNSIASFGYSSKFFHNNGKLILVDPAGTDGGSVYFDAPLDMVLNKVVFDVDGASWMFRTPNLIVNGDLEIRTRVRATVNYPKMLRGNISQKITLKGNLICSGENTGGNLLINLDTSITSTYKITNSNCKLPSIGLQNSNSIFSEDPSSLYDLKVESLSIANSNLFVAPAAGHKLIIEPVTSDSSSYAFLNQGTFDANQSEVVFSNIGDGTKEFIVNNAVSNFYNLKFLNNSTGGNFFNLQSSINSQNLVFEGSQSVNLKSSSSSITTDELVFNKGLTSNASSLYKIIVSAMGANGISVNTSDRINLRNLEIKRNINLVGTSNVYDFSGALLTISAYDLYLNAGSLLYYFSMSKSSGSILGSGLYISGAP